MTILQRFPSQYRSPPEKKPIPPSKRSLSGLAAVLAGALLVAGSVPAQADDPSQYNNDYYAAAGGGRAGGLLKSVEHWHLGKGIEKMNAGRYAHALDEFEFILRKFPNHPRALALAADVSLKAGRAGQGEEFLRRAVEVNPTAARTQVIYGVFLQKSGRLEEAVRHYRTATELEPDSAEAHYNLGLAYVALKRFDAALESAYKAYALGHPLPGLRNKLEQAGAWKPARQAENKAAP
jgi:tetratricopeptide (TPR) repeat protein